MTTKNISDLFKKKDVPAPSEAGAPAKESGSDKAHGIFHMPESIAKPKEAPAEKAPVSVKPAVTKTAAPAAPAPAPVVRSKSIIAEGMVVKGDIVTKGDLTVQGGVLGNISAEGDVHVAGKVSGSICANAIELISGEVRGEKIEAKNCISVAKGVVVAAQVEASCIKVDGKVEGNISVADSASFSEHAEILGDVSALHISVAHGARFDGKFVINKKENPSEPAAE